MRVNFIFENLKPLNDKEREEYVEDRREKVKDRQHTRARAAISVRCEANHQRPSACGHAAATIHEEAGPH